jgi:hypothetical protein
VKTAIETNESLFKKFLFWIPITAIAKGQDLQLRSDPTPIRGTLLIWWAQFASSETIPWPMPASLDRIALRLWPEILKVPNTTGSF